MGTALVTFSNGETIEFNDGQSIITICKHIDNNQEISVSQGSNYKIWFHNDEGLIPSICELLCRCDFFQFERYGKAYSSASVVGIENL